MKTTKILNFLKSQWNEYLKRLKKDRLTQGITVLGGFVLLAYLTKRWRLNIRPYEWPRNFNQAIERTLKVGRDLYSSKLNPKLIPILNKLASYTNKDVLVSQVHAYRKIQGSTTQSGDLSPHGYWSAIDVLPLLLTGNYKYSAENLELNRRLAETINTYFNKKFGFTMLWDYWHTAGGTEGWHHHLQANYHISKPDTNDPIKHT